MGGGSFLANNQIIELEPLASCARLQAVSLFRNQVTDLDAALMVFDSLPGAPRVGPLASVPSGRLVVSQWGRRGARRCPALPAGRARAPAGGSVEFEDSNQPG